jgi:putative tricarboxylic transport membrane protein
MDAVHAHLPKPHDPFVDLMPNAFGVAGLKLTPRHYAYLKISEGCNHRCTFCIIPSMRGDLVSRPIGDVLKEAHALFEGGVKESENKLSRVTMSASDWRRSLPAWLRGTAIGAPFGCIPAGGTEIPTFLSYAVEKKLAKGEHLAEFGNQGAIEGVAGPEAANNATVTTALIPLLTLGIPVSNTTAILLGAFQNYGIQPGPQLFSTSASLVWALIASLYIGNVMLLVLNLPLVGLWVKLLKVPKPQLYAGILIFATVGAYGMRQSAFDLVLLYGIGLLGLVMRRFDFPTAPVVVGMILGPLAEAQLRNALSIGEGKWTIFLERPMSLTLLCVVLLVLVLPRVLRKRK